MAQVAYLADAPFTHITVLTSNYPAIYLIVPMLWLF